MMCSLGSLSNWCLFRIFRCLYLDPRFLKMLIVSLMVKCCIPICQCYVLSMLHLISSFALTRVRSSLHRRFTKFISLITVETSLARIRISVLPAKIDPFCLYWLFRIHLIQRTLVITTLLPVLLNKCVSNQFRQVNYQQSRKDLAGKLLSLP